MKRLTIHLNHVEKRREEKFNSITKKKESKSKIYNTLTYYVSQLEDAHSIINDINDNKRPRNNVKSWYLSNIR